MRLFAYYRQFSQGDFVLTNFIKTRQIHEHSLSLMKFCQVCQFRLQRAFLNKCALFLILALANFLPVCSPRFSSV